MKDIEALLIGLALGLAITNPSWLWSQSLIF